tara:strand:- start:130 stop:450 length:321 start_codon:yes stop_codon:yes gene_type:complete
MAIEKRFTTSHGIDVREAYHKVIRVVHDIDRSPNTTVTMGIFFNKAAAAAGKDTLDTFQVDFNLTEGANAGDILRQSYTAVKTKTSVKDSKGRTFSVNYTSGVKDV